MPDLSQPDQNGILNMESTYANPQAMGQSPFFYYNPDPKPDNRQHGHFSQHPQGPVHFHQVQTMPSTPVYSRPTSSCSPVQVFNSTYNHALQSPRPMYQKPAILTQGQSVNLLSQTEATDSDMYCLPSTPPLSTSGSSISSPSSCDVMQTPLEGGFFGFESLEGVKNGCQADVKSEILARIDWNRCTSPPMTPVFIHPHSLMTNTSELLSATACPSLSPSPSPYPSSSHSEQELDFCDPRNLTVGASQLSNTTVAIDFPPLPTLCAGDDEEHKFMLVGESFNKAATQQNTFDFSVDIQHTLPSFDEFSDLDSEEADEFVNGLVNFPPTENVQFFGNKRQRTASDLTASDLLSFHGDTFISEDEFEDFEDCEQFAVACPPSPPVCAIENEMKPEKRNKKSKDIELEDSTEFDTMVRSRKFTVPMNMSAGAAAQENSAENQQQSSTAPSQSGSSENNVTNMMSAGSDAGSVPQQAPVNRRGRKQSLTEDPSKTFVCDLCNRRFRRQEHLKRHYRSLHTQEKPFECHECGKKFSRSDNLSQHARTHGSGAIIMGVLEDGELPADHPDSGSDGDIHSLGKALFEAAAAVPGSEPSDSSSDSDGQSRKKRKRSE